MAIELKQSLKLSQQLVITPQLQQAIKLLQLSRLELSDLIQNELLENPILEEAPGAEEEEVPSEAAQEMESEPVPDKVHEQNQEVGVVSSDGEMKEPKEFDWENYLGTYNDPGENIRQFNPDDLPTYENFVTKPATLQDHLEWQIRMSPLSEEEEAVGITLVGLLDDNGYLSTPPKEIAEKNGTTEEVVRKVLSVIQDFDPPGVAASDLKECLLLQVRTFGEDRPLLETIIRDYLHLLERKDYNALSRKLKVSPKKAVLLAKIVTDLEPKPGRPFGKSDTQYITPDVYVYKVGDDYAVVLNEEGLPRLRVSAFYRQMMAKQGNGKDAARDYVQEKLRNALWLIKSIHQRQRTLYRVAKCIVKFQKDFMERGISALRPMILKDVAEEIGMHESTVSRATSNKFMHTPQGIFELKFFFNSGVSVTGGEDIASESVKQKIKGIVAGEDVRHPMSDKEIVTLLKQANIDIARRTVAKYREMIGILPSSKRRQLC